MAQRVKNPPAMQETWVRSLGCEDSLKKGMATHSSNPSRRIPWTEEPGGLQSMGLQRVIHDWATNTHSGTWTFNKKTLPQVSNECSSLRTLLYWTEVLKQKQNTLYSCLLKKPLFALLLIISWLLTLRCLFCAQFQGDGWKTALNTCPQSESTVHIQISTFS